MEYCRDYRDTQRAATQKEGPKEKQLVEKLRRVYNAKPWQVNLHVITLGVTGTIYTDLLGMLEAMQVDKREAQRCAKNEAARARRQLCPAYHAHQMEPGAHGGQIGQADE